MDIRLTPSDLASLLRGPVLFRGLVNLWPAQTKWSKEDFRFSFGSRKILPGSTASIVYSGGSASEGMTIDSMVAAMATSAETLLSDNEVLLRSELKGGEGRGRRRGCEVSMELLPPINPNQSR